MSVQAMKTTTFQNANYEKWKKSAVKSLRGMPFEKLITKTIEGIDLQPLYTKDNVQINFAISTIRMAQEKAGWVVAQQQYANSGEVFISKLINSLERGNEAIVYDGAQQFKWDKESLEKLARLVKTYPIYMKNTTRQDEILNVFKLIPKDERHTVNGAVSLVGFKLPEGYSNIRTIGADIIAEHLKGADAVTELALVIAEAAELVLDYEAFNDFGNQFFVRFAIDTHFFMEIAKIRAFRALWQTLGKAFAEPNASTIPVLCETSLRTYSKLDPYVNLLRAGNETFSSVLGGADVISVHPHDLLTGTNAISERIARNVQLVIKEETLVGEVVDPAGGSYFIETLTTELVEQAWNHFLEIDAFGGYKKYIASGKLAEHLHELYFIRREELSTGEKSLIGTNVYADLGTHPLKDADGFNIERRLAEPFEKKRREDTNHEKT